MAGSNKEVVGYWSAVSLAANKTGDSVELRHVSSGTVEVVWADATATDAVVKLQESVNGAWFDIASQTVTISAATGTKLFKLTRDILLSPMIRAVLTKNTETTGTVTISYFFKGDR